MRVDGSMTEEDIGVMGVRGGSVVIRLKMEPGEAKRVAIAMLDEANYCEEEGAS